MHISWILLGHYIMNMSKGKLLDLGELEVLLLHLGVVRHLC